MRCFVILCVLAVPVFSAPEGYKYREPAPVVEKNIVHGGGVPCKHAGTTYNFDAAATALINSQSEARIVNNHKAHYGGNNNLETAASGYSPQSSGQFGSVVKGSSSFQGSTNTFSAGQGYVQNSITSGHIAPPPPPPPSVNYIPVSQIPPASAGHHSHPITQVAPPLAIQSQGFNSASSHSQSYSYNQPFGGQQQHQHHQVHNTQHLPGPPNHRPQPIGLSPPGPIGAAASQHSSSFAHQQTSNFGGQQNSAFVGQQNANFAAQSNANANFGAQHSANFGSQHTANFAGQQSANFASGGVSSFTSSSLGADALNGQLGNVIRETVANAPLDPFAEKHIYVHIPPEDMEANSYQASLAVPQLAVPAKKHYKIVFIKAPTHATPNYSQLAAAAAPKVEEKTLIYVLVKKPEEPSYDQIQELTQSLHKSSKPEVYFIKYKTQKEGEVSANSVHSTNSVGLNTDQVDLTAGDGSGLIDIRAGGNTAASTSEGPKHELYGVPLQ